MNGHQLLLSRLDSIIRRLPEVNVAEEIERVMRIYPVLSGGQHSSELDERFCILAAATAYQIHAIANCPELAVNDLNVLVELVETRYPQLRQRLYDIPRTARMHNLLLNDARSRQRRSGFS